MLNFQNSKGILHLIYFRDGQEKTEAGTEKSDMPHDNRRESTAGVPPTESDYSADAAKLMAALTITAPPSASVEPEHDEPQRTGKPEDTPEQPKSRRKKKEEERQEMNLV